MIRKVRPIDSVLDRLVQLESLNFGQEAWNKQMLLDMFSNKWCMPYAYYIEQTIVGYCVLVNCGEFCDIANIVVDKQYTNRGIGSEMMQYMIDKSIKLKVDHILLEVNTLNERAIRLYEKHGFKIIALRKNFYAHTLFQSNDAYSMLKKL
ncbi:MAG: N-acetyltransferase [Clostridia bacterium]|nr:N-acetyltransferase [Clostridia bacterium]